LGHSSLRDAGLLLVTDLNPIDEDSYAANLEAHLQSLARDGAQALLAALFALPTTRSDDGPLAQLPPPATALPRAKPLPKPAPPTTWEQFAAAKGIQHKVRDKREWDEERQDWVSRWGRDGKNRRLEAQWITEVPANADVDFDPRKAARVAKNEKQRLGNAARAAGGTGKKGEDGEPHPRDARKQQIERTLATSRISTASMGKFDHKLDGEKKVRGVKRKVCAVSPLLCSTCSPDPVRPDRAPAVRRKRRLPRAPLAHGLRRQKITPRSRRRPIRRADAQRAQGRQIRE
jgi:regulator of ribosome biosynthesis